jgi:lambda family phage portal protein
MAVKRSRRTAVTITPAAPVALGGLEGADTTSRRLASWRAPSGSADVLINRAKPVADDRGRDLARNDPTTANAVKIHQNSIVGSHYRLSAMPNWLVLGATEAWAEEFQKVIEARFTLLAESPKNWLDASRKLTLTDKVRLAVASFVVTGESLQVAEWIKDADRPCRTAIQHAAPARLNNPNGVSDSSTMRRGVEIDARGRPIAYHVQSNHPGDFGVNFDLWTWKRVRAELPWGRPQVLHIFDPLEPGQNRGLSDLVAAMETMQMTRKFRGATLENAIVNATVAAAIESELPSEVMVAAMGGGTDSSAWVSPIGQYLSALDGYVGEANGLRMDGAMIPHLFPGSKLTMKPAGTPGGVGTDFEGSLLRHTAAGLGVSYEELSRDYARLSYSGGRLSLQATERFMAARKRLVADKTANFAFTLWLEEEINRMENIPPLPGKSRIQTRDAFYAPLGREAFCRATWIGASAGQTDEMKETQAAVMRVRAGFSTKEAECAKLGKDYREVFDQLARENKLAESLDLDFSLDATKHGKGEQQATLRDNTEEDT